MKYIGICFFLALSLVVSASDRPLVALYAHGDLPSQADLPQLRSGALSFNGTSSSVGFPAAGLAREFTFLVWCSPLRQHGRGVLICKVGWHTQLGVDWKGNPYFSIFNARKKAVELCAKKVVTGEWVMLAAVSYGDSIVLYVDGNMVSYADLNEGMFKNTGSYYIGCANPSSKTAPGYYAGLLNGARVWHRALSPEDISKIYSDENKQYKFDQRNSK